MPADLAKDLGDDAALAAVDRFAEANFSRITNKSGFLMVRPQSTLHERCRQHGTFACQALCLRLVRTMNVLNIPICLQGIIRRVQEDGPGRGNVDLDILPRSVRNRLKDVIEDVSLLIPFSSLAAGDISVLCPPIAVR